MTRGENRARQFAELLDVPVTELDPEALHHSDSDAASDAEEPRATEHYVAVGKSKLRKPQNVPLGPAYTGARVSRKALEESDDDEDDDDGENESDGDAESEFADPDTVDLEADEVDGEIDSETALCESDAEKFDSFVFRGSGTPRDVRAIPIRKTAADFMSDSDGDDGEDDEVAEDEDVEDELAEDEGMEDREGDEDGEDGEESVEDDEEEEDTDGDDDEDGDDDDDDEDGDDASSASSSPDDDRAELRKMMNEQKTVLATVSKAAQDDIAKGTAVKQQRKTFDLLLNARMRLQKALVSVNSLAAIPSQSVDDAPYLAAEAAAVKLWTTLDALRSALPTSAGHKRSHAEAFTTDSPTDVFAAHLSSLEAAAQPSRAATLDKWSSRVRGVAALPRASKLLHDPPTQSLTAMLQSQLADPTHLVARARTPRGAAPLQAAAAAHTARASRSAKAVIAAAEAAARDSTARTTAAQAVFDDSDFYQLLLKDLIEQRSADAATLGVPGAGASAGGVLPSAAALKLMQTKKAVDTRASKGRKMRFVVQEKLQNFMAPRDVGAWEEEAVQRFFGGLLGRKVGLAEEEEEEEEEAEAEADGDEDMAGLRLF